MVELLAFLIILTTGFFSANIFRRFHIPYVTALILGGIILGPFVFDLIQIDATLDFLGTIGVIFLMFIAGSETKIKSVRDIKKGTIILSLLNGLLPFITGFAIGYFLGFDLVTSAILGIVFISSSVAAIIPSLESTGLINTRLGRIIITSTVFEDIASLLLLAFILQSVTPISTIPLYLYIPLVIVLFVLLKLIVLMLRDAYDFLVKQGKRRGDIFENRLEFVLIVLIGTVILFEFIGIHAIVAGFIIGVLLSDSLTGKVKEKIHTLSYGVFIPVFFILLGIQTDLSVFYSLTSIVVVLAVIFGLIISKVVSGWIGGRLNGFTNRESLLIGVSTTPQLSTTLAAAFAALEFGLLTEELVTALIILSVVTTFLMPVLVNILAENKYSRNFAQGTN